MSRFAKRVSALAALGLFLSGAVAHADETVIRAISAFPKPLAFSKSFAGFVDLVNKRGAGVVRVDYVGGPEMIPPPQQADAVARGVVDMQYGPATYHLGKLPEADAWVGSTVTAAQARANGGLAIMREAFKEKLGVELIAHLDTGVKFHIYTIGEPKRTSDGGIDLDGMKLRSQPIYKSFFESMGGIPVSVRVPDVYTGLERGTFDGAGWPLVAITDLGWNKFLKYRIDPGFFQTDLTVIMNPKTWDGLSSEARKIITDAAVEYEVTSYDNFQTIIADTDKAVRDGGMTVITLDDAAARAYLDGAYDSAWGRLKASGSPRYDALRKAYYTR